MDSSLSRLSWTSWSLWILKVGLAIVLAACAGQTKPVQPSQKEVVITSTAVKPVSESSPLLLQPVPSPTTHQTAILTPEPVKSPSDRMISRLGRHWSTKMAGLDGGRSIAIAYGNELCVYPFPISSPAWCRLVDRSAMGFLWALAPQTQEKMIAVGLANGKIRLLYPGTGEVLRTIVAAPDNVRALAWSPDGTRLASGSDELRIKVWEVISGQLSGFIAADQSSVVSLAWSPDGSKVAGGTFLGKVILWDAHTFEKLAEWKGGTGYAVASLVWTQDSRFLYAGTNFSPGCGEGCNPVTDGKVARLDGASLQLISEWTVEKPVLALALSPDQQELTAEMENGEVWLLKADLSQAIDHTGGAGVASGFVWTEKSEILFLSDVPQSNGSPNRGVFPARIGPGYWTQWSPRKGTRVETALPIDEPASGPAWSPDGTLLSMGTPSGHLLLWNRRTGAVQEAYQSDFGYSPLAWSPDGSQAALLDAVNQPVLVDTRSFQIIRKLDGVEQILPIQRLLWSPGGQWLAGGNWQEVVVWDLATGKVIFRTETKSDHVFAWSPSGDQLAVSGGMMPLRS